MGKIMEGFREFDFLEASKAIKQLKTIPLEWWYKEKQENLILFSSVW